MSRHLKHYETCDGFKKIAALGDGDLKLTEFGIIALEKGGSYAVASGAFEVALVVLGGTCAVSGDGFDFPRVGERKDVFSGKPYTVYIPCGRHYTVTAVTDVEIAWAASPLPFWVTAP